MFAEKALLRAPKSVFVLWQIWLFEQPTLLSSSLGRTA
jgi:hypothetical protein